MVANKLIRVGKEFLLLKESFNKEVYPVTQSRVKDAEFTNYLARVMREERMDKVMARRVKFRGGLM